MLTFVACGGAEGTPPSNPGEIDLTRAPESRPLPPPPLAYCKDEPQSAGCGPTEQENRKPAAADSSVIWKVPVDREDPTRGPSDALVTVVVFSDFQCPFCKQAATTLSELFEEYSEDARLVWKDFPLPMHVHAEPAALFALAVWHDKGNSGFWAAHDLLFEQQAQLDEARFRSIARRLGGLDFRRIQAGMRQKRHGEAILRDVTLAERVDVHLTPTVFINGRRIVGAQPLEKYEELLREELEKAEALVEAGTPRAALYARLIANGQQLEPPSDLPEATE